MRIIALLILSLSLVGFSGYSSLAPEATAQWRFGTGSHNHTCGNCGYTWTHRDGASYQEHFCPNCGRGPWLVQSNRPASTTRNVVQAPKPVYVPITQPVQVAPRTVVYGCNPVVVQKDLSNLYKVVN